jgi:DNA end-binding protein Ku
VRADGDLLALETLFFADEVREPHQQISNLPGRVKLTRQELRMARQLIESMTGPWQPSDYRDTYTDRVNDLIKAKKNNEEFQPADEAPPGAGQRRKSWPGRASQEGTVQEADREEGAAREESGQTAGP